MYKIPFFKVPFGTSEKIPESGVLSRMSVRLHEQGRGYGSRSWSHEIYLIRHPFIDNFPFYVLTDICEHKEDRIWTDRDSCVCIPSSESLILLSLVRENEKRETDLSVEEVPDVTRTRPRVSRSREAEERSSYRRPSVNLTHVP